MPKYSKKAQDKVEDVLEEFKQAIAIALSEAQDEGAIAEKAK